MAESERLPVAGLHEWALPSHGLKVETVDAHAGGQSLRVILRGVPPLRGRTMEERQAYVRKHFDHLRRSLLFEPRGHAELYACLLTPPEVSSSHFGVLFMNRGGFVPMCGHGIIALATVLLETGIVEMNAPETLLRLDTPAGLIRAYGQVSNDHVDRVFYEFGPARAVALGRKIEVPGWGVVTVDLAWAGGLLAFVEAGSMNLTTAAESVENLSQAGTAVLKALGKQPGGMDGREEEVLAVFFTDRPLKRRKGTADGRQVAVAQDGGIDRSPGGMGICARMALMHAKGELPEDGGLVVEGITGSTFRGKLVGRSIEGGLVCEIEGQAWVTGQHAFLIAADDPFRSGFLL